MQSNDNRALNNGSNPPLSSRADTSNSSLNEQTKPVMLDTTYRIKIPNLSDSQGVNSQTNHNAQLPVPQVSTETIINNQDVRVEPNASISLEALSGGQLSDSTNTITANVPQPMISKSNASNNNNNSVKQNEPPSEQKSVGAYSLRKFLRQNKETLGYTTEKDILLLSCDSGRKALDARNYYNDRKNRMYRRNELKPYFIWNTNYLIIESELVFYAIKKSEDSNRSRSDYLPEGEILTLNPEDPLYKSLESALQDLKFIENMSKIFQLQGQTQNVLIITAENESKKRPRKSNEASTAENMIIAFRKSNEASTAENMIIAFNRSRVADWFVNQEDTKKSKTSSDNSAARSPKKDGNGTDFSISNLLKTSLPTPQNNTGQRKDASVAYFEKRVAQVIPPISNKNNNSNNADPNNNNLNFSHYSKPKGNN